MSFSFMGENISYSDIENYFNKVKNYRDEFIKKHNEKKLMELQKFKDSYNIIKNHENFLIDLNNKKLYKYFENPMISSVFKYKSIDIDVNEYEKLLANKNNHYEISNKDDNSIDEVSDLMSNVLKFKESKNNEYQNDIERLHFKLNVITISLSIAISLITFSFISGRK